MPLQLCHAVSPSSVELRAALCTRICSLVFPLMKDVGWFHEKKATLSRSVRCDCSLRGPSDGDEAVVDSDSSLLETQRRIIYVCNVLASH